MQLQGGEGGVAGAGAESFRPNLRSAVFLGSSPEIGGTPTTAKALLGNIYFIGQHENSFKEDGSVDVKIEEGGKDIWNGKSEKQVRNRE